ncbi:protein SSUH2 homolog isoform X1 [Bufo gargarizans]|uniref:protein SSUH2 homolog isoform X1 n=2 Tax=Bufo gargarizans TaxID=30331 RepID=UPI001CF16A82|nr:protein SSUH2 homolog isoform X1 [Bufo gargarizans]
MEEHRGIRAPNSTNYGAMGQPFDANYLMPSEKAMTSALMNPAMAPAMTSQGAPLTAPAVVTDGPTAPPSDWEVIPGYEGMGSDDGGKFLPPAQPGLMPGSMPTPANTSWTIPSVSENDARNALKDFAKNKCCYRTTPAEEMDFHELRPFNTYRYRLETFTESRTCKWVTTPYNGQSVDSPVFGIPPQPWDVPIQIPAMFKDEIMKMPVPHTSSLKACPQCLGICKTVCKKCHGTGRVRCWVCNGTGRRFDDPCHRCRGQGTESCTTCHSTRYERCVGCSGRGQILNYIELTVTWKNNIYEFVAEHNSEFPTDLFKKVNGEMIFMDEQMLLSPLVNFPAQSINQSSQNALQQHRTQFFSTSRVLRQRHSIEWLPLTKVEYIWRGNRYDYFVYGKENQVYTDNYPQKCCCVVM